MNANLPKTMHAVVLTGHGGFDKMEYRTDVPVVAKTYDLKEISKAQKDFLEKKYVGKLVLIPPQLQ